MIIPLDHAATTPLAPEALAAMLPWLQTSHDNPASDHAGGRQARAAVETARAQVASLVGAAAADIIWTSGATESINLALKGALEFRGVARGHIVSSRVEHKATLDTLRWLERQGHRVTLLTPDAGGHVTPEQVLAALTPDTVLVSLMWVNNEIGVVNPIEALAPRLRERGVLFHVDAAQAAAWLPIDLSVLPVDLLSLSAHKLYGPKGIGALYVCRRPRARLAPQIHGGGQEQGMRSGTLPTHQIVGFGAAAARVQAQRLAASMRVAALRERLWDRLSERLPGIQRNGRPPLAPHILNLSFDGVDGESLRARLPDLAVSSGSACSSATREPSFVLRALGHDDALADASLRCSLGYDSTAVQVDAAAQRMVEAVSTLRDWAP